MAQILGTTQDFVLRVGNTDISDGVSSVDLPDVNFETEDITTAGVRGTISKSSIMNVESMEATININGSNPEHAQLDVKSVQNLKVNWITDAMQLGDGQQQSQQNTVSLRVQRKNLTLGTLERQNAREATKVFEVLAITHSINGSEVFHFDKTDKSASGYRVNGTSQNDSEIQFLNS